MYKKLLFLIAAVSFLGRVYAVEIKIDAHVDVKFKTTVNISTVPEYNEHVGAVELVFPLAENLYKPIDNLPEPVTNFRIEALKISAPSITGAENFTVSTRLAYKTSPQDAAVPLFSANNWTATTFKNGSALTAETGLSGFNSTLLADIRNENVPRELINVLFVIKIKIDGSDAALVDLDDLDLQLELTAKVDTKAAVLDNN